MNKVERRVRDLNKQLGLMDVSDDELERMASSVSFFDEKYEGLVKIPIAEMIACDFDSDDDLFISYDSIIDFKSVTHEQSLSSYAELIRESVNDEKLAGDEYLIKIEFNNRKIPVDNITLITLLYLLSSFNKYSSSAFVFKPILKIRRNKQNTKFTLFYFLNNDIEEVDDLNSSTTSKAKVELFNTIERLNHIEIDNNKFRASGCCINDINNSFYFIFH